MSRLDVVNLQKSFGSARVVNGLSFSVEPGEIFGLLGPNGAGKTTTMSIIAGLLQADAGEIRLNHQIAGTLSTEARQQLGLAPQDLAIYPDLTARENLEFFGKLYGLSGADLSRRCDEVLDQIGLTAQAGGSAGRFSGGMKRRLNFGVALMHRPPLLILDEPTVGVDPQSRNHLLDCVRQEAARGAAVIYASHYMEEVSAVCHRVAIIDHGRLLTLGPLHELLSQLTPEISVRVRDLTAIARERLGSEVRYESSGNEHTAETRLILNAHNSASNGPGSTLPLRQALEILDAEQAQVIAIETRQSSLERLFLELTGRSLRD